MSHDWTFEGQLNGIAKFAAGNDSTGAYSCCFLKNDSDLTTIYFGTDLEDFNTYTLYSSVTSGLEGAPTALVYRGDGKVLIGTGAGKMYEVLIGAGSAPSAYNLVYTDAGAAAIDAVAYAATADEYIVSAGGKIQTVPPAGGLATERIDSTALVQAGAVIVDIAEGDDGKMFVVRKIDGTMSVLAASTDWAVSKLEGDISADVRSGTIFDVNYNYGEGSWIAGRGDLSTVSTDDLSNWVDLSSHSPLWVATGGGKIAYSTDGSNWTENTPVGVSTLKDITFGKNTNDVDTWYACSTTDSVGFSYTTDITDVNSWSTVNPPGSGGGTALEYGANGTIIMGREHENYAIRRSTDYGINWTNATITTTGHAPKATDSLATNGSGVWVAGMGTLGVILKSYDDGVTWYKTADLGSDKHVGIEYANGVWVATEEGKTINICTSIAQSNSLDTWTQIDPPGTKTPDSVTYVSGDTWLVGGGRRNMWKSTDNAASWSQVTSLHNHSGSGTSTDNNPYSLASDGTNVVAVGRDGHINLSTDNGDTWTVVHTMTSGVHLVSVEYNKVKPF